MSETNFQKLLLEELVLFFDPVVRGAASPASVYALIESLGWSGTTLFGPPPNAVVDAWAVAAAAVVEIEQALTPPPESIGDLTNALGAVTAVVEAIAALPAAFGQGQPGELDTIVGDLLELLTLRYLRRRAPVAVDVLRLLTVIRDEERAPVIKSTSLARRAATVERLELDRIPLLLGDPAKTLRDHYFPGGLATTADATLAASRIFPVVAALLSRAGARAIAGRGAGRPLLDDSEEDARSRTLTAIWELVNDPAGAAELGVTAHIFSGEEQGPGLLLAPFGSGDVEFAIGAWRLAVSLAAGAGALAIKSGGLEAGLGDADCDATLTFSRSTTDGAPLRVGSATGTRFEVAMLSFTVEGDFHHAANGTDRVAFGGGARIQQAALVIAGGDGDGFLQKVLPADGLRIEFDFGVGWSSAKGLYFQGSVGLEATLPLHLNLLEVLKIESVYLAIQTKAATSGAPSIELALATSIGLSLGPIDANVDRIGLRAILTFPASGGNLGPANIELGFKPPRGVGMVIDASVVKGGGFILNDPENGRYAGILQLKIGDIITVTAIGLVTTRMPDGSEGFSLLVIITATFPPIQLGVGFTLAGLGGLLGLNRTMNVQALRDGVRTGVLHSILFPVDPVARATKVISDVESVFPVAAGRFTIGLMVRLGWGSPRFVTADVGIIVALPMPLLIALIGRIGIVLPDPKAAVVVLQLDVVGILDFSRKELSIDATLHDSRIAVFDVYGDMAVRIGWGESPAFLISIGGFNPRFVPPPGFPQMRRLTIALATSDNPRVRLETYFAITSNTLQVGARLDIHAELDAGAMGLFAADAYLGFDALVVIYPFEFVVDLSGGIVIKRNGAAFIGAELLLTLYGPQPLRAVGYAEVNFLGKHRIPIQVTVGPDPIAEAVAAVDPLGALLDALGRVESWSALPPPTEPGVSLRQQPSDAAVLAHPMGTLAVRQRVVPLGVVIDRYGGAPLEGGSRSYSLAYQVGGVNVRSGTPLRDAWAPGDLFTLTDDEKLSRPSFQQLVSGDSEIAATAVQYGQHRLGSEEAYETSVIDGEDPLPQPGDVYAVPLTVAPLLASVAVAKLTGAEGYSGPPMKVSLAEPTYVLTSTRTLSSVGASHQSWLEAHQARGGTPGVQVVASHEVTS